MSIFSDKLRTFVKQKGHNIYSLAKYCRMDRSNMYKIVQGTRHPASLEVVENIAQSLALTPFERKELLEAWHVSEVGEYIYFERKLIAEFIGHLKAEQTAGYSEGAGSKGRSLYISEPRPAVSGKNNVNICLKSMIEKEAQKETPEICLICQPEQSFLLDLLAVCGSHKKNFKIRHLICMESFSEKEENKYNLQCLNDMAPLLMSSCKYHVYYYYDKVQSHFYNMNILPYMLLTSESVMLISSDFEYGIYSKSEEKLSLFHHMFEEYTSETEELFKCGMGISEILKEYKEVMADRIVAVLCPGPLSASVPLEISSKYLKRDDKDGELLKSFMEDTGEYVQKCIVRPQYRNFFTEEGIRDFMDHSHIIDMMESYYETFSEADRLTVLENMRKMMLEQHVEAHLIRPGLLHMQRDFYMTVYENGRTDMMFKNTDGQWRLLSIHEKSLGESFYNFTKYLTESTKVCGLEESLQCLEALLEEYRERFEDCENEEKA